MSYRARPDSILAGWRIRNSLTAKGSSITAKLTVNFNVRPPSWRPLKEENREGAGKTRTRSE
jgi:hypothetical protein